MTVLEQLYRLQVIDRRLQEVEAALADQTRLREWIEFKQRERSLGAQLKELEGKLETFREWIGKEEEAMKKQDLKIAESEKRLYDGTNRGARELEHMEAQMEAIRQARNGMEQHILEVMEMIEHDEEALHALRDEYESMVTQSLHVEQELKEFRRKLHHEQKQLQAARKRVILTLPDEQYQHYVKVAAQHDGIAVARVKQNRCSGCQMTLSPSLLSRVRYSQVIEHCEYCGRILFDPSQDETGRKRVY